jgi:spore photoproduct lyase
MEEFKSGDKISLLQYGNGILRYFYKTPKKIVCPHFWELNWAYGCPFDCAYCYLQGTLRGKKGFRILPLKHVISTLHTAFNGHKNPFIPPIEEPTIFNSGELTDSLAEPSLMEKIMDEFEKQKKHKILLLTKSCNVNFLLEKVRKQVIISFSINAPTVWKLWEKKTPSPHQRIEAAKKLSDIGYIVRIRIDPIFPIKNWQIEYGKLIKFLLSKFTPERITLGTPRGLAKTKMYAKDLSWWIFAFEQHPSERTGWGMKIATQLREKIYHFIIKKLQECKFTNPISLCKETEEMWKKLRMDPGKYPYWENCKCNCVW